MKLINRCNTCKYLRQVDPLRLEDLRNNQLIPNTKVVENYCEKITGSTDISLFSTTIGIYVPEEFGCVFWEEAKNAILAI